MTTEIGEQEFKETFLTKLKQLYAGLIEHGQKEGVFRDGDPLVYQIVFFNMINPNIINQMAEFMSLEDTLYFLADLALHGALKK